MPKIKNLLIYSTAPCFHSYPAYNLFFPPPTPSRGGYKCLLSTQFKARASYLSFQSYSVPAYRRQAHTFDNRYQHPSLLSCITFVPCNSFVERCPPLRGGRGRIYHLLLYVSIYRNNVRFTFTISYNISSSLNRTMLKPIACKTFSRL